MEIKGIDVSVWQGKIDWQSVQKSGIDFAIIREGFGRKEPCQVDRRFKENINGAKSVGISCGVYHYSYAKSPADAVNEANFCLENIQGYKLEYPVVLDIEDKSMMKLGRRTLTDICTKFCETIESAGYYTMIYTNLNWLQSYLYADELLKKFDLWLAAWDCEKAPKSCGIWQYSDKGKVSGISGNVDMNISYKNYPEIIKKRGLNGWAVPTGNAPSKAQKKFFEYAVKKGDTLWSLSQKYLENGTRYKEIKSLNNLTNDAIYTGQTLKIPK